MRFVFGLVLALSVGIGAYLGSAQVASSAKATPRTLTMPIGDVAVVGQIRCLAWTDSRSSPISRGSSTASSARPRSNSCSTKTHSQSARIIPSTGNAPMTRSNDGITSASTRTFAKNGATTSMPRTSPARRSSSMQDD